MVLRCRWRLADTMHFVGRTLEVAGGKEVIMSRYIYHSCDE